MEESLQFERLTEEKRKLVILKQLNLLISTVLDHNKFYRANLKVCLPLTNPDELKNFPVLRKADITSNFNALISDLNTRYKSGSTSGSTGLPLKFLIGNEAVLRQTISYNRFLSWYGIQPFSKHVLLWGPYKKKTSLLIKRFKWFFYKKQYRINVFELDSTSFRLHYDKIKSFKPVYLRSYKSGAMQFAEIAAKLNVDLKELNLKLVNVTSEVLMPDERRFIEKSFGCPVGNEYGASEIGQFAFDCPEGKLHINDDVNYLRADAINNVYVTSLYNTKFPFINYEIGDQVIFSDEKCSCGRTMPLIERVNGRTDDYILKSNGEHLSQYAFYYLFEKISTTFGIYAIRQYKIIQTGNTFHFEIVKGPNYAHEIENYISVYVSENIGNNNQIIFNFVDQIQREPNGKLRFFKRVN